MIRRVLAAVFLACSAVAVLSCGSSTEPEPYYKISVEGVVTDAATGEPMVGFEVEAARGSGEGYQIVTAARAVTDSVGFYAMSFRLNCDLDSDTRVAFVWPWWRYYYAEVYPDVYCTEEVQVGDFAVSRDPLPEESVTSAKVR